MSVTCWVIKRIWRLFTWSKLVKCEWVRALGTSATAPKMKTWACIVEALILFNCCRLFCFSTSQSPHLQKSSKITVTQLSHCLLARNLCVVSQYSGIVRKILLLQCKPWVFIFGAHEKFKMKCCSKNRSCIFVTEKVAFQEKKTKKLCNNASSSFQFRNCWRCESTSQILFFVSNSHLRFVWFFLTPSPPPPKVFQRKALNNLSVFKK